MCLPSNSDEQQQGGRLFCCETSGNFGCAHEDGRRTMPIRSTFNARASLHFRRAEPFREGNYFHHVYGNSARVSNAAMLCDPFMWHSKSWRGERPAHGEHMFASRTAQQQIWQHQHPEDCSVKRFLLYAIDGGDTHGIGSTLHYATWA